MRSHVSLVGLAFAASSVFMPVMTSAQDKTISAAGAREFSISCAVCHGKEARGNGPLAKLLTVKTPDLTKLSKNN